MFWQQLLNGLTVGSVYALIALGLTMVYGVLRILHVAHAGVLTFGAYMGLVIWTYTKSLWLSLLLAMALAGLLGMLIERWVYSPLLSQPRLVPLIASLGLFIMMEDLFRLIGGAARHPFPADVGFPDIDLGVAFLSGLEVLILVLAGVLLLALWFLSNHTTLGLRWRAAAQDRDIAMVMGVNVNRVIALNFLLGSAFAAAAGVMVGVYYNAVFPTMGSVPAYKALAIIVVGGLGSVTGTVVAGLVIGVLETLLVGSVGFILPRDSIAFLAMIALLIFRPYGLFGEKWGFS